MTVAAEGIVGRPSARSWRRPWSAATVGLSLLVVLVCLLTMTPIGVTIVMAFRTAPPGQPATWGFNGFVRAFSDSQITSVIWTSLWLSVVRAVLATVLAIVIAWIIARTDCPARDKLFALITLSFFFPVIAKVLGWAVLGSPRTGYLNQFLRLFPFFPQDTGPIDVFSYGGLIFVSVLGWSTFLIIFLIPAFKAMDASLEESARMAGATARETLFKIMVPLMRPAIVAVMILALVRMFSSFEVEYFLGSRVGIYVFTNKIYERLDVLPADYQGAFVLVFLLMIFTFGLVLMNRRLVGGRSYTTVSGRSYSARPMRLGRLRWLAFAVIAVYLFFSLILPAAVVIQASFAKTAGINMGSLDGYTLDKWIRVLTLENPRRSLINSLIMSVTASTVGMILYSVVAYVVTRTNYRGRKILDFAAWLPWGVPTLALGLGVLWAVLASPLAALYGTLWLLILAHIIRGFPVETRVMASTFVQVGKELEESARIHGGTWLTTFRTIWVPLLRNGFLVGWTFGFTISFGDIATVAFLQGPDSVVLPTLFLSLWRAGELETAAVAALINTIIVVVVIALVQRVARTSLHTAVP